MDTTLNVAWFSGGAAVYDRYRPSPPADLVQIVSAIAGWTELRTVVDLGCGTGISSRYWATNANQVIGIEPNADMYRLAVERGQGSKLTYRMGRGEATGLASGCAQLVSCFQSFHWMEPTHTLAEIHRILEPGGGFVAADYDWPPVFGAWPIETAWRDCIDAAKAVAGEHGLIARVRQWDQKGHLDRIQRSGWFRFAKEVTLQAKTSGDADYVVGALLSQGAVIAAMQVGATPASLGVDALRRAAADHIGSGCANWYWSSRVRIALK